MDRKVRFVGASSSSMVNSLTAKRRYHLLQLGDEGADLITPNGLTLQKSLFARKRKDNNIKALS